MLNNKGTQNEAKTQCKGMDSTLITIKSEKEQKFLSQFLAKYRGVSGYVWIGLEYVGNKFTWIDGNDMSYQNWDENAVKDGINKCVDMLTVESDLGKWMDDSCNKKYLIACQKKQDTKTVLSEEVKNLTNVIEKQQNELKSHQDQLNNQQKEISSLIPIGFLYTQLPSQSSPDVLWPNMKWTEVTQSYAGLFFRAEGGNSSSYGQLQLASAPHLTQVNQHVGRDYNIGSYTNNLEEGIETKNLYTGSGGSGNFYSLSFKLSNEEVRPINKAVRIWKRTK